MKKSSAKLLFPATISSISQAAIILFIYVHKQISGYIHCISGWNINGFIITKKNDCKLNVKLSPVTAMDRNHDSLMFKYSYSLIWGMVITIHTACPANS